MERVRFIQGSGGKIMKFFNKYLALKEFNVENDDLVIIIKAIQCDQC